MPPLSVIPTEVEGSRAVCGARASTCGPATDADSCTFIQAQLFEQGVHRPYNRQLLASAPALDLLLAVDSSNRIIKQLGVNQPFDSIFFRTPIAQLVFIQAAWRSRK